MLEEFMKEDFLTQLSDKDLVSTKIAIESEISARRKLKYELLSDEFQAVLANLRAQFPAARLNIDDEHWNSKIPILEVYGLIPPENF